ncbi:MAG: H-NS histone family protein [Acidobacteriaceae bacterium]|nr:H-NS histone family protein [Acidobacteriaceae bacterium]
MNHDTLNKLTDPELSQVIAAAQGLLQTRAEKRKNDAMEQIRQIAATAQIAVSFDAGRKAKSVKAVLRAGDRYVNPADASQSHIVGKGKPPYWFAALRDKNRLPAPVALDSVKSAKP